MEDFISFPFHGIYKPALSANNKLLNVVPICVDTLSDRRISNTHWHDYLQIWYTVSGNYLHTINGITYRQEPGSAMLIFPYMRHYIDSSQSDLSNLKVVQISVGKNVLEQHCIPYLTHSYNVASFDALYLYPHVYLSGRERRAAEHLCMDMLSEYGRHKAMHIPKLINLVANFLELCADPSQEAASKREISTVRARIECIDEAMNFLTENNANRITLDDVSRVTMMSRRNFTLSFSNTVGQTCKEYIYALRMNNAITMLRKTEKGISEIAEECGFYDSSHFRLRCVEMYGVSPLTLRKDLSQWTRDQGDAIYKKTFRKHSWALTIDEASAERHWCAMSFY